MKLIDTHCHVNFKAYDDDRDEIIKRSLDEGTWMINVGSQIDTSRSAVTLASQYEKGVYASIGLHPAHTIAHGFNDTKELGFQPRQEVFDVKVYQELLDSSDKIIAVGETGLDYYRLPEDEVEEMKKLQYEAFMAQAEFAAKNELPLIIHCRDAHDDQLAAIKEMQEQWGSDKKGVIHCYTGTYEQAKRYVDDGWYIGFTGICVFADEVGEVAQKLPLESILVETDAPYLSPPPFRGKRNEPSYVKYIAEDLARRKGVGFEEVAAVTNKNASKLFNI